MSQNSKTDLIVQLLAANVDKASIMVRAKCSQALVYKVLHSHADEIAAIRANQPSGGSEPTPTLPPAAPAPSKPSIPEAPSIPVPQLDPLKPAAPQLESMAWQVLAAAASGGDVSVKQANAARDIIRQAARDRTPPPTDRKLVFKIDVIDFKDGAFQPVAQNVYTIR